MVSHRNIPTCQANDLDNVDRVYQKSLPKYVAEEEETVTPTSTDIVSASVPQDEPYSFQRHLQFQPDYQKTKTTRKRSPLSSLIDKASTPVEEAEFQPEEEDKPFPLALLPPELLEPIFNNLDVRALERFGTTCWRARLLTFRADIWKRRVKTIYKWPMVHEGVSAEDLAERHDGEWRTTFIEEDRVRMDGCYISVCHYVRPGSGDEWVAVTHMITYHRFLRFYPDGTVISFLTTDQ
jgi:F-box protein 9